MLLEALVACAGVTLKAVATALEVELSQEWRSKGGGRSGLSWDDGGRQECAWRIRRESIAICVRYRRRVEESGQADSVD